MIGLGEMGAEGWKRDLSVLMFGRHRLQEVSLKSQTGHTRKRMFDIAICDSRQRTEGRGVVERASPLTPLCCGRPQRGPPTWGLYFATWLAKIIP